MATNESQANLVDLTTGSTTFVMRYRVVGRSLDEQMIDLANSRTGECGCGCEDETAERMAGVIEWRP